MKKIIFIITLFAFSFSPHTYADGNEVFNDGKTIKDLKEDIDNLNRIEDKLDAKIKNFLKDNNIDSYIKKWLSDLEYDNLKNIINNYLLKNSDLEKSFYSLKDENILISIQEKIISIKKDLYKNLVPYIEIKKYKSYLKYVEKNIKNFIEKNNLYIDKLKTKDIYIKKVNILEKKIEENKKYLDIEVKKIIEKKIDEKLSQIIDSSNFIKLSNNDKIITLEKVIENLNIKINSFRLSLDYDSVYIEADKRKLEIYNIIVKKLLDFTYTLK